MLTLIAVATALSLASLGGGLYEVLVVDPSWPRRPDIFLPQRGGISRKRFWIPAHTAFELALVAALIAAWEAPAVRGALLAALACHASMRIWSAFDFIPKALVFERAALETIAESDHLKALLHAFNRGGADHAIDAGSGPAPHEDGQFGFLDCFSHSVRQRSGNTSATWARE